VEAVVRGVRLRLHPSPDYITDHIVATGDFYEAAILDELARRVTGGTLVDVGAMIGNHTSYLAAFVSHDTIHAFEPEPRNFALLEANTDDPTVVRHRVALSDRAGVAGLTTEAGNAGHTILTDGSAVPTATLDSYALRDVSLVKVDVEGHERQVLAGARETLTRWRPLVVVEDWERELGPLMAAFGYRLAVDWGWDHQTYLYRHEKR
jgi:FkbM family methyltransferase